MSDTGPSCPSSPQGHFSYIFCVFLKNAYLPIVEGSVLHKIHSIKYVNYVVQFFYILCDFLSFDLSVSEIVLCIKSLTIVVNLTISPFCFIKISFQQNEPIFLGLDISEMGRPS